MKKLFRLFLITSLLLLAIMPTFAQNDDPGTIADIVVASTEGEEAEFTTLLAAVQAADPVFLELLSAEDAFVAVFAPTDAAFEAALADLDLTAEELLADTDQLNQILAQHVLGVDYFAEDLVGYNNAYIGTLLPNGAVMIDATSEGTTIGGAEVVTANIEASNGIIHSIGSVILPPPVDMPEDMMAEDLPTIADIVIEATAGEEAEFTTLLAAVEAADPLILDILSAEAGQTFTVFAPTDAAFEAALADLGLTAEEVLGDVNLVTLLLAYHVLPGQLSSTALDFYAEQEAMGEDDQEPMLPTFATLFPGGTLEYDSLDGTINDVSIVTPDVFASNGVVHIVDSVLLPDFESIGFQMPEGEAAMEDDMEDMPEEATEESAG